MVKTLEIPRLLYRSLLFACIGAGAVRVTLALLLAFLEPKTLLEANAWGVPRWGPLMAGASLTLGSLWLARSGEYLWLAVGAVYGAGAWAFATPMLGGVWWALMLPALPAAWWPIALETSGWAQRAAAYSGGLVVLGLLCSLFREAVTVAAAGALLYTASLFVPIWTNWQIQRRST